MNIMDKLWAREQIRERLFLYCRGIDRRDWDLVRSCFADGHKHRHGKFKGTADEFVQFASKSLLSVTSSQHAITNVIVNLSEDGLSASTDANFYAVHRIEQGVGETLPFDTGGVISDWRVAGRYRDKMVLRDNKWLIINRDANHDWERVEPSIPRG